MTTDFHPDMIDSDGEMEAALYALFCGDDDALLEVVGLIASYEEAGVLTMNRGLVLGLTNGAEFQITIVQSNPRTSPERR